MNKTQTLEAGLVGWRERFAEKVLGALFFVKSALYVGRAIRRAIAQR